MMGVMIRRWAVHFILALALVVGQQGAALHALSHYAPEPPAQEDKHSPDGGVCEKCVAFAKFASAPPTTGAAPLLQRFGEQPAEAAAPSPVSLLLRFPPARGPPALL